MVLQSKCVFIFLLLCLCSLLLYGQDTIDQLRITPQDIRIEQSIEGGYYLIIRKSNAVNSVMLVESTEDPERRAASYAYQNPQYHHENGNEKRILNGEFMQQSARHFLIDSTPQPDSLFGEAFRIFIPYVLVFGYDDARSGEVQILNGAYLNIRSFSLPYADYTGLFQDNPYTVAVRQTPLAVPPESEFMEAAVTAFQDLSIHNDGILQYAVTAEDIIAHIQQLIPANGESIDVLIALDTTRSMRDEIPILKNDLIPMLQARLQGYKKSRTGFVLYRDYREEYLVKNSPFQEDLSAVQEYLNSITVDGGHDIPEAVYEALWAGLNSFDWKGKDRFIFLVGDAPPHPLPRGGITQEKVSVTAAEHSVTIHSILLPQ